MSLTVITGRANAGKSGALYRPLIEAAREGGAGVLLLPSHADVVRARAEFADRASIGIQVDTLDGWAAALWAAVGDGRRIVDDSARQLAVHSVLNEVGPALRGSAQFQGFGAMFADVCARSAGLDPSAADRDIDRELVSLLGAYRSVLSDWNLIEIGDALVQLSHATPSVPRTVSINRFSDFSPQQERFILRLGALCDLRIGLTYERGLAATEMAEPLVGRLISAGALVEHCAVDGAANELTHVEGSLYSGGEITPTGMVAFVEADGPEAEISSVAEQVARAVREGTAPERVAVVFRRTHERLHRLESALAARGMDAEFDIALPFTATPYGAALSSLLSLVLSGAGGREALVAYLKSPYADVTSERVDELDRQWRRSGATDVHRMLGQAASSGSGVAAVIAACERLNREHPTGSDWSLLADTMLQVGLSVPRDVMDTRVDAAAHRAIVQLAEVLDLLPETAPTRLVLASLVATRVSTGSGERLGAVLVTEAHRIRGRRFDVVVLGGLTAAEFSASQREPLVVTLLGRLGLAQGGEERLSERMLFYSLVTRAREQLVLVRQSADAKGEAVRPSVFWDETIELYRHQDRPAVLQRLGAGQPDRAFPAFDGLRFELRRRAFNGEMVVPCEARGAYGGEPLADDSTEFAVTELETYLSCPYRWFYERAVRPKSIDRTFDARAKGSVAHELLARTYRALRSRGIPRVQADCLAEARSELHRQAETLRAEGHAALLGGVGQQLAWDQAVRWGASVLQQDVEFLPEFLPVAEEWTFGESVSRPVELGGVRLRGAIDRIDRGSDGIVVTDYKSSSTVSGIAHFESKGLLQPIVYAAVAGREFQLPAVAGLYRSLSRGTIAGFWNHETAPIDGLVNEKDAVSEGQFREVLAWAESSLQTAADGIRAGRISPAPKDGACTYCGARAFCGAVQ